MNNPFTVFEDLPKWKLVFFLIVICFTTILVFLLLPSALTNVTISVEPVFIRLFLAIFGVACLITSPVYFVETWQDGDYQRAFMWSMLLAILGIVFVIAGLW